MQELFFELLRFAIGAQQEWPYSLSPQQWRELYEHVQRQALLGICFAGVSKARKQGADIAPSLYSEWMATAAITQQRNEQLNRQCAMLQQRVEKAGMRSFILKGQGLLDYYPKEIAMLRQPGDIDIWIDESRKNILEFASANQIVLSNINIKHADAKVFRDTEVEFHFTPTWFYNPIHHQRFKQWLEKTEKNMAKENRINQYGIASPTADFNVIYLLIHIYRHVFDEGIGLRQLMDYYFVLNNWQGDKTSAIQILYSMGMRRFVGAVMWVLACVYGLNREKMLCEPNERDGQSLLCDVMHGGNFGRYGHNNVYNGANNAIERGLANMKHNLHLLTRYPSEVLCAPFWKVWHWGWRQYHHYL